MIKSIHKKLSARKQCGILAVLRSSLYNEPKPEKPENVNTMHLMDVHLPGHPTEEVDSMEDWLWRKAIL